MICVRHSNSGGIHLLLRSIMLHYIDLHWIPHAGRLQNMVAHTIQVVKPAELASLCQHIGIKAFFGTVIGHAIFLSSHLCKPR